MARQSISEFIIRTALRAVIYLFIYKILRGVWRSRHPYLYSALILLGLILAYQVI